jgi:hypothetical protein
MQVSFHPEAEKELSESIEYYEDLKRGLGLDFASEVYKCIGDAYAFPAAWSEIVPGIRRVLVRRFPFGILYAMTGSGLYILAVMNLHRQPNYWMDRWK